MLELYNKAMKTTSLQRYMWHIYTNLPLPAHVYLLCALRFRTTGEFVERAWQQLSESVEIPLKYNDMYCFKKWDGFLYYAIANMTVKAWEARETAIRNLGRDLPTPYFVSEYQRQLATKKSRDWPTTTDELLSSMQTQRAFGGPPEFPFTGSSLYDTHEEVHQQNPFDSSNDLTLDWMRFLE